MSSFFAMREVAFQLPNGNTLFDQLSFSTSDALTALVAANGRGKSVLLKLLNHQLVPSHGSIEWFVSHAYIPQQWQGHAEATVAEVTGLAPIFAVFKRIESGSIAESDFELAEPWWQWQDHVTAAAETLGGLPAIDWQRPISSYSGGEQFKWLWLGALLQQPDYFLFDEPTNHLDAHTRARFIQWLKQPNVNAMIATHDRSLMDSVHAIAELTEHALLCHPGNYSAFATGQQQRWQLQRDQKQQANREVKKTKLEAQQALEKQQQRAAVGKHKANKRNLSKLEVDFTKDKATAKQSSLRKMNARRNNAAQAKSEAVALEWQEPIGFELPNSAIAPYKQVLTLRDVSLHVQGRQLATNVNCPLQGPSRLHITGTNGCGKSLLLRALMGLHPLTGEAVLHVPYAFLAQQHHGFKPDLTAIELCQQAYPEWTTFDCQQKLAWLRLRNEKAQIPFGQLSGGEQMKVALTIALLAPVTPQLLILDEPTNHLDLDSVLALENALKPFKGAMIVVSHDEAFVNRLGITHCLALS